MTRQERLARLVEFVVENGSVHVDQVVAELQISPATARRDLDALADQQLITRTRGGASANKTTGEVPLRTRQARQWREKSAIGSRAASLVNPGEIVGFNGGTTTTAAAYELGVRVAAHEAFSVHAITVVTNAVNIANDLTIRPQVRVVCTGGVARTRSYELVGPLASMILPSIHIDTLFLGVTAINTTTGLYTHAEDEASINAALVQAANRTIVLADHTKFDVTAFARICPLDEVDLLITNELTSRAALDAIAEHGVEVMIV